VVFKQIDSNVYNVIQFRKRPCELSEEEPPSKRPRLMIGNKEIDMDALHSSIVNVPQAFPVVVSSPVKSESQTKWGLSFQTAHNP